MLAEPARFVSLGQACNDCETYLARKTISTAVIAVGVVGLYFSFRSLIRILNSHKRGFR